MAEQIQFSPFHPFIELLMAVTLFNPFRLFGNEFQLWPSLKDSVSNPFFVVKAPGTLESIHVSQVVVYKTTKIPKISFLRGGFSLLK